MFRKVLVANRGEIAARIIAACHAVGAKAVAVYSEADAASPHLELADETLCIGPAPTGRSYLDQDALLEAALVTGCQALHPGFGFLSENARFATRCRQQQLTFIGPPASCIRAMGDKATARRTMEAAGVPVLPGSKDLLGSAAEAAERAAAVGYPVILKATAGGGGRGMRLCEDPARLQSAFHEATAEAGAAFGNAGLYLEKYVVGGRHIEFQVLADRWGTVLCLGERECSVQRNHQKLIEEAPAPGFSETLRHEITDALVRAMLAIGYEGAGTVEFLMDASGKLYFMEMNTRLQVEHPVTELVTGVDIVAWQLRIAAGQRLHLRQEDVRITGHAIECRINAEDPAAGFRPSPGRLERLVLPEHRPQGPLRIDTHVREGYRIPTHYDSMIAKVIAHGDDRAAALQRMGDALGSIVIEGFETTIPLHRAILAEQDFAAGSYTCQYIAEHPALLEGLRSTKEVTHG